MTRWTRQEYNSRLIDPMYAVYNQGPFVSLFPKLIERIDPDLPAADGNVQRVTPLTLRKNVDTVYRITKQDMNHVMQFIYAHNRNDSAFTCPLGNKRLTEQFIAEFDAEIETGLHFSLKGGIAITYHYAGDYWDVSPPAGDIDNFPYGAPLFGSYDGSFGARRWHVKVMNFNGGGGSSLDSFVSGDIVDREIVGATDTSTIPISYFGGSPPSSMIFSEFDINMAVVITSKLGSFDWDDFGFQFVTYDQDIIDFADANDGISVPGIGSIDADAFELLEFSCM